MRDNQIESVNYAAFSDLPQLETIYLANNKIKSIAVESFTNLDQLQTLRLPTTQLRDLRPARFRTSAIKEIRLDNNPIHRLVPGAFRRYAFGAHSNGQQFSRISPIWANMTMIKLLASGLLRLNAQG